MSDPINPNTNLSDKFRYLDTQIGEVLDALLSAFNTANGNPGDTTADRLARIEDHIISVIFNTQSTGNPPVGVGRTAELIRGLITTSNTLLTSLRDNTDTTDTQLAAILARLVLINTALNSGPVTDGLEVIPTDPVLFSTSDRYVGRFGYDGTITLTAGREATFAGALAPAWLSLSAEGLGAPLNRVTTGSNLSADARFFVQTDHAKAIVVRHTAPLTDQVRDIAPNEFYSLEPNTRYSFEVVAGDLVGARQKRPAPGYRSAAISLRVFFFGSGQLASLSVGSNQTTVWYPFGSNGTSRLALFPTASLQREIVSAYGQAELPGFVVPGGYSSVVVQNNGDTQLQWARFRNGAELAGGNLPANGATPNFGAAAGDVVLIWRSPAPQDDYFDAARVVVQATNAS